MNIGHTLGLCTALTLSAGLHAQTCSGGPEGGMDATGNQCTEAIETIYHVDPGSTWQRPGQSAGAPSTLLAHVAGTTLRMADGPGEAPANGPNESLTTANTPPVTSPER